MFAYATMIVCAGALVAWVYHADRYEKEPWYAIALALTSGFGAMWVIGLTDDAALRIVPIPADAHSTKAALISLIEEGGKLVTILVFAAVFRREFNDPMDGLIYGRLIGLGMAVNESLLYLGLSPPTLQTCGAEIVRLFGHSLMAGLVGFAIGLGGHPLKRRESFPRIAAACLAVSMLLHFGWDWVAYSPQTSIIRHLAPLIMMAGMFVIWRVLCDVAEARSKRIFVGGSDALVAAVPVSA